jgi:beta-N-acetylhexosaminidase
VKALASTGVPLVTVALRTPWDLAAYPEAGTHLCTYSILRESMDALAAAIFGRTSGPAGASMFQGRLPVRIAGIAESGHGVSA